jgi:hypothetical protein
MLSPRILLPKSFSESPNLHLRLRHSCFQLRGLYSSISRFLKTVFDHELLGLLGGGAVEDDIEHLEISPQLRKK